MRGYFGFGAEGISKPMNMGNLVRSAHAFGAKFIFTFLLIILFAKANQIPQKHQTTYLGMIGIILMK